MTVFLSDYILWKFHLGTFVKHTIKDLIGYFSFYRMILAICEKGIREILIEIKRV